MIPSQETGPSFSAVMVGCGPRGEGHANAYRMAERARLVACVDADGSRAEDLARRHGVPAWSTDLAAVLAEHRPHLVDVCTSASTHGAVVEAALDFRPAVLLVEKPMTVLPEEGYRMIGRCEAAGVALIVNHQLRFLPPLRELRDILAGGALGVVRTVRTATRSTLLEQGTHLFDLIDFLLPGRLGSARVLAQTVGWERDAKLPDSPEYTAGVISCADDTRVFFECGPQAPEWTGRPNPWHQAGVEIIGTTGRVTWSLNRGWTCESATVRAENLYRHEDIDDPAEAVLLDSLAPAPQLGSRLASSHPNAARVARRSFDLVMAAQASSLRRDWVDVQRHVDDDTIAALREAQLALV